MLLMTLWQKNYVNCKTLISILVDRSLSVLSKKDANIDKTPLHRRMYNCKIELLVIILIVEIMNLKQSNFCF